MILAGDIGGTKCNLALYDLRPDAVSPAKAPSPGEILEHDVYLKVVDRRYESSTFGSFDQIIDTFLSETKKLIERSRSGAINAAGFGVAGPVLDNCVRATNLPWVVDGAALARQLGMGHVVVLNDLEATGYGLSQLNPSEIVVLNRGLDSKRSTQALLAAGTGLGEAILFWDGERHVVASSEGGHTDFAPRNEREIGLLRHMKKHDEFVSWELILSGRGFRTIHEFLDPSMRHPSFDQPGADPAAEITRHGLTGECPICAQTLDMWVSMYGAEAGNLALKALARGGVWVAGGIAVKIRKKMEDGIFFRAFCEKEKFAGLMAQIPIFMVLNEEAPLIGAMAQASRIAGLSLANEAGR